VKMFGATVRGAEGYEVCNTRGKDEIRDKTGRATQGVELRVRVYESRYCVGSLLADMAGRDGGADYVKLDKGTEEEKDGEVIVHAVCLLAFDKSEGE
jgi:hypothetical protein